MAMGAYHGVAALLSPQRGTRGSSLRCFRSVPAQYPAQCCRWQVAARNGFVTFRASTFSDLSNKEPHFRFLDIPTAGTLDRWNLPPWTCPEHARCSSQREKRHPEDPALVVCACDCAVASCSGKGTTHKQLPFRDEIRDSFLCESRSGIRFTTLSNC